MQAIIGNDLHFPEKFLQHVSLASLYTEIYIIFSVAQSLLATYIYKPVLYILPIFNVISMVSILLPSPCMVWKSDRGEERKDGSSRVAGGTRTLAKMGGGGYARP